MKDCLEIECIMCFCGKCHNVGVLRVDGKCETKVTWKDKPVLRSARDFDRSWKEDGWEWDPGDCHYLINGLKVEHGHFLAVLARLQDRIMVEE